VFSDQSRFEAHQPESDQSCFAAFQPDVSESRPTQVAGPGSRETEAMSARGALVPQEVPEGVISDESSFVAMQPNEPNEAESISFSSSGVVRPSKSSTSSTFLRRRLALVGLVEFLASSAQYAHSV